jgi:pimeloyl-ACP methyl ester carboxylesterase
VASHRQIIVREWGEPGGRPLLFWPGLNPSDGSQLLEVGPLLADRGFHVLAIAPPGTGGTPPLDARRDYRPSRLADLVLDVADAHGVDRFVYMGHSWGGSIGAHLGARHPNRLDGIVLLDGGHVDIKVPRLLRRVLVERFERRYRDGIFEPDGDLAASSRAAAWALHGLMSEPPSKIHERITVPVLLLVPVHAAASEDVRRFHKAVPHAVVEGVDSGHDIPEDAPDDLVAFVADWLG